MDNKTAKAIQDKWRVGVLVAVFHDGTWRIFGQCIQTGQQPGWMVGNRYCISGRSKAKPYLAISHKSLEAAVAACLKGPQYQSQA